MQTRTKEFIGNLMFWLGILGLAFTALAIDKQSSGLDWSTLGVALGFSLTVFVGGAVMLRRIDHFSR